MCEFFAAYDWTALSVTEAHRTRTTAGEAYDAWGSTQVFQLGFKQSGRTDVVYNGTPFCYCGGTVLYLPQEPRADVPYRRRMTAAGDGAYVFFRSAQPLPPYPQLFVLPNPTGAAQRFERLVQLTATGDALAYSIAFYRVLQLLRDALSAADSAAQPRARLAAAARFIRAHACGEYIDFARLAAEAHMTPDYFRHCFRATYGVSPQQFFLQEKLEQAKRLLLCGASVAETAAAVGVRDANYFSRFFRSRMGVSPTVYVQQRRC